MLKDPAKFAQTIQTFARSCRLDKGKQLHARLIITGGFTSSFVANHLLIMYSKCGDLCNASQLFDKLPEKNLFSWTAMITGFAMRNKVAEAHHIFSMMCNDGISPTEFALSSVIQAAASLGLLGYGKQLHGLCLKLGLEVELFVGSNLADLYSKCGDILDCCKVFDEMPYKDQVSWNTLIDGYVKNNDYEEALGFFKTMVREGNGVDQHIFCSTLNASGGLKEYIIGRSLHSMILKFGFESEGFVANALIDMYCKCRDMDSSSRIVGLYEKGSNVVSFTSLIDGYVEMDEVKKALIVFVDSQKRGIKPNEFTLSSILKGCASHALLDQGMQIHTQAIKTSIINDSFVSAGIIEMYSQCGLLKYSLQSYNEIEKPNYLTWNLIIGVLAQHGCSKLALEAFNTMILKRVKPNEITFVNLLMACSYGGLISEGLDHFYSMQRIYNVEPTEEHYACIIDMLGRAGRFKQAEEFLSTMPCEPNAYAWCSLLSACKNYGNTDMGEFAAKKFMKLEPSNSGIHTLLSSIYATSKRWEDVKAVRKLMKDNGLKKLPGLSWVDVGSKTHIFGVEGRSYSQKNEISETGVSNSKN